MEEKYLIVYDNERVTMVTPAPTEGDIFTNNSFLVDTLENARLMLQHKGITIVLIEEEIARQADLTL